MDHNRDQYIRLLAKYRLSGLFHGFRDRLHDLPPTHRVAPRVSLAFFIVLLLAIPMTRHAAGKISRLLSVLGDLLVWDMALSRNPLGTLEGVGLGLAATFF